jgi:DNA-binding response OmpR family regulator
MKKILIIEPDNVLANIYSKFFSDHKFKTIIARNAQQAIFIADEKTPDVVVLELQLTEHSGIEFLYEFRSYNEWINVPIIINSQIPPREFKENWDILTKDLGVSKYLYKPVTSLAKLMSSVNEYVEVKA